MNTIFLDTETTGIAGARLVELAYQVQGAPAPVVLRCKPPIDIEIEATVVNGIRTKDVAMLLLFNEMPAYAEIKETLENAIIVGHNVQYDVDVLEREGIHIKPENMRCTKELAKKKWPESPKHSLQYLRYWLDMDVEADAHSGYGDVKVLMVLWDKLHEKDNITNEG